MPQFPDPHLGKCSSTPVLYFHVTQVVLRCHLTNTHTGFWSCLEIGVELMLLRSLLCVYSSPLEALSFWRTPVKTLKSWWNLWQPMAQKSRKRNKSQNPQNHLSILMIKDQRYVWNKIVYQGKSLSILHKCFMKGYFLIFPLLLCLIPIYLNSIKIPPCLTSSYIHNHQFFFLSSWTFLSSSVLPMLIKVVSLQTMFEGHEVGSLLQNVNLNQCFLHWRSHSTPLPPKKSAALTVCSVIDLIYSLM